LETDKETKVEEQILVRREGAIVTVTFNRPEKRNAFTVAMYGRLGAILDELSADDSVRCVVLEGAGGKAFSAGSDIGEFDASRAASEEARDYAEFVNRETDKVWHCPHPTIARIQGVCVGGGLEIATMCDVRIASSDSRFGIPAARLGVSYGYTALERLTALTGPALAKEIMFLGRQYTAEQALAMRLVNQVVEPDQLLATVEGIAAEIVRNAPLSIRASKIAIDQLAGGPEQKDRARVEAASRACFDSADYKEGRRAFMEKRTPQFQGR
jgi:enoyl-CoA hydratase/carnithine racemase